ncbi:histidine phosphatase family protein [Noviherbaspirillum aerium]|uniref:histidine phosphatase family protein n=1 Tax=Noviherbaspirillum aerium TaxID=2588497 RepID=UPI001CEF81E3|nr:histidine phosphatase family protein [Noviherbaspirillum aerium]
MQSENDHADKKMMEIAMTPVSDRMFRFVSMVALFATLSLHGAAALADQALWPKLRQGGHVILMRHAVTVPGVGDPSSFALGDCSTQRNLSAQGRDDARQIGKLFRDKAIPVEEVWSSRWCRCIDTALIAFEGVKTMSMLDSIFNEDSKRAADRTADAMRVIPRSGLKGNLVLVTHQQNIQALTGESLSAGEMLVTKMGRDGRLELVGRMLPTLK